MNPISKILTAAVAVLCMVPTVEAKPARPKPDVQQIDNGTVKIGVDRSMGASITWLSWKGHPDNAINLHDPGRLLQQSYYAGNSLERIAEGQSKHWSPWTWNPIQGGGVNSWARVTKLEKIGEEKLISETVPKLWDMADEEAEALMLQLCEFESRMPNAVVVRNRLICKRGKNDRWGEAQPRHQELPAAYFARDFDEFLIYEGNSRWQAVTQEPGPPWGRAHPKLKAMACFNPEGQGIGIFSPAADGHWNFGPVGGKKKTVKPTDASCVHLAPIGTVALGPRSVLEYRYWIVCGSKAEIALGFDQLMGRYRNDKIRMGIDSKSLQPLRKSQ